jgi:S-adenosylmethionine:tRNA ribosyltransferase-isomerase
MRIDEFDYDLPEGLIAQQPLAQREASRMLVVDRGANSFTDKQFTDITTELRDSDLLVVNNTKVFPARLYGRTESGAGIEIFLVRELETKKWEVLAKPGRRLRTGKVIIFSNELSAEVIDKTANGEVVIEFHSDCSLPELIDELGQTPLPPYIKRDKGGPDADRERYQTIYAEKRGAIAAPTAGLHFTPEIIDAIKAKGVEVTEITLHVGYGTFEPVRVEELSEHAVQPERYEISEATADRLNSSKSSRRRIVAVGTTTTRALESNIASSDAFSPGAKSADLTITPGFQFQAVDALLTNFHLPKSSLLVLTSTFGGHELIMKAYRHAVASRYRFYSYGDCMLIV